MEFKLHSEYKPTGDQPDAIEKDFCENYTKEGTYICMAYVKKI